MTAPGRVLRLSAATLRLSENDDLDQRFSPRFGRIELWADTVEVHGWVRLHGREIRIRARCIVAAPAGERPAVIDVSGAPAQPDFDPGAASPRLAGTPSAPDGQRGRDGGPGQDGGVVDIVVDEVRGALGLAANGSRGGNSERGGNGARPATVNGVDAAFLKAKWPRRSAYGGGVLQKPGAFNKYVAWAAGQSGGDAKPGGAAGAAGQPGNGGRGGRIGLRYSGPTAPTLATIADGGAAGLPGEPAQPGAPGAAGTGGRNRIYVYDIFKTHEAFARAGADKVVDGFARRYRIAARAPSGKPCDQRGRVPPPPTAAPGVPGEMVVEAVSAEVAARDFDLPLLQLVLAHAERDRAGGDARRARARYGWLIRMTAAGRDADAGVATLQQSAERALAEMGGDDVPAAPLASSRRSKREGTPGPVPAQTAGRRSAARRSR